MDRLQARLHHWYKSFQHLVKQLVQYQVYHAFESVNEMEYELPYISIDLSQRPEYVDN